MAPSNASIDRHEQLGTISQPLSFIHRTEEEILLVSRRNALTAVLQRVVQASIVCASLLQLLLLTGLLEHIDIFALHCKKASPRDKQTQLLTVTSKSVQPQSQRRDRSRRLSCNHQYWQFHYIPRHPTSIWNASRRQDHYTIST